MLQQKECDDRSAQLSCPVVVADDRPHALHDPVGRHIDESLELVIHAEDSHVDGGDGGEDPVQDADQDRGEQHHDAGRNHDTVDLSDDRPVCLEIFRVDAHGVSFSQVDCDIQQKRADLPDDGGDRCSCSAEPGKSEKSEDEDRIKDDVDHTAHAQQIHGDLHFSDPLEDLLKCDLQQCAEGKAEHNVCIVAGVLQYYRIIREKRQERSGDKDPCKDEEDAVEHGQRDAERGGAVRFLLIAGSKMNGYGGADPHPDAYGNRDDGVLERVSERDRSQRICPQPGYIDAVHDIVKRLDQHGEHHRNRHGDQKRKYRFCLHKSIFRFHNKILSMVRGRGACLLLFFHNKKSHMPV